jgi:hypothetical protein
MTQPRVYYGSYAVGFIHTANSNMQFRADLFPSEQKSNWDTEKFEQVRSNTDSPATHRYWPLYALHNPERANGHE